MPVRLLIVALASALAACSARPTPPAAQPSGSAPPSLTGSPTNPAPASGPSTVNAAPGQPVSGGLARGAALAPPAGLTATTTLPGEIDLHWSLGAGDSATARFIVQRSLVSNGPLTTLASLAASGTMTYQDLHLAGGATCFYKVYSVDSNGIHSATSPEAAGSTLPASIGDLQPIAATVSSITLAWTSQGTPQYQIFRGPQGGPYVLVTVISSAVAAGGQVTFSQTLLPSPGTRYAYVVAAKDPLVVSPYSNEAVGTTLPTSPGRLSATASGTGALINWTAPAVSQPAVTEVEILRSTSKAGIYAQVGTALPTASSFQDEPGSGAMVFYKLTATDAAGASAASNPVTALTIPAVLSGVGATAAINTATVTWPATPGAASYNLYRSLASGGPYTWAASTQTSPAFDTGIAGTTYYYVVRSYNASGEAGNSNETNVTMAPPPAAGLIATRNGATIVLAWHATSGALGYAVSRSTTSGGPYSQIGSTPNHDSTTYTDATVLPGGTYYYVILATNSAGSHSSSNEASATLLPPAPTALMATAIGYNASLTWTAPLGAVSFTVYRSATSGSGYISLGSSTAASFVDSTAPRGGTFYYVVTATNAAGTSPNSNESGTTIQPGPATGLTATGAGHNVALSWTGPAGATGYTISRSATSGAGYALIGAQSGTTFTDTTAPAGCTCYYVVTSNNTGGTSGNSNEASAVTMPAPATGLTATTTGNGYTIALAWKAPAGATSYSIYRSPTSGSGYASLGSVSGTAFTDTKAPPGGVYYYVVTAANAGGTSANSNEANATVLPAPPAGLTATSTGAGVALTWTAAGSSSFTVYRSVNSGTGYVSIGTSAVASFTDNTASAGGTYYYVVTSTNSSGGTSGYSNEASTSTKPSAVTDLTVAAGFGTSANLTWSATTGATNYSIFRGSTAGGEGPTAIGSQAGTSFNDPAPTAGSTWFYVVTASNAGGTSGNSNEASVTLKPAAISSLAAAQGSGSSVNLTWAASPGATSYIVYRGSFAGGESPTGLGTPAGNSFTDNGSAAGATWFYVVAASNAGGTSTNSNEASFTSKPAAATLAVSMGAAGVHLTWTAVVGATGYSVFRGSTAGGEDAIALGSPAGTSFDDGSGAPGTTWFYVVTASNTGGASPRSNEATITIKPGAVTTLAASLGASSSINLTWTATTGATSYKIYRGSATGAESATALGTTVGTSFNDNTAAAGGTYFYVITASNVGGTSGNSNEANLVLKPTAVSDLSAAPGAGTSINLTWSAPPGATNYRVFRGSIAAGESITALGSAAGTSFNDATATAGSTWFYVVTALNKGGTSGNSNEASLTLKPAQVQNLFASVSGTTVTLSWTATAGATRYSVFSGSTSGGESAIAIGTSLTASYADASLLTGKAYFYTVAASNAGGTGAVSAEARAVTAFPPPTSLVATANVFDISLSWTGTANAVAYDVLRSTSPTDSFFVIASVNGTTFCNCGINTTQRLANTTYFYEIVARTVDASSAPSSSANATTVFPAPLGLAVANTGTTGADRTRLGITWTASSGASAYSVQRSLAAGGPFSELGQPATNNYTDSGLALSTTYYYRVLARSAAGVSPPSLVASGITLGSPWLSATGLNGGEVKAVLFDPTSSGKTALAAVRGGAGIYRSIDSGQTWTASGPGLSVASIASLTFSQGRFFAGSFGAGVFSSTDGGQNWTPSNAGLSTTGSYTAIAAGPTGSSTLYAATPRSVYVSTLNGDFWKVSSFAPAAPILGLAVDTGNAATVYATTDGAGLYKSTDSGATWAVVGLAGQSLQGGIVIDPAHPLSLRVGTAAGVQASTDGGATWTAQGSLTNVRSLALTGTTLYAGTNDQGVFASVAGGAWTATNASAAFLGGITTMAAAGTQVLAGSYAGHGIFHSSNSGAAWSNATAGITAADATALAISADASELFAVAGHQLLKSVNHGASWSNPVTGGLPYPVIATAVVVDPTNATVVYVGSAGVSRSSDGGATFVDTGANFVPAALAIPAQAHNLVYAAIFNGGVYKADFSAATPVWTPINTGLSDLRIRSVTVDPSNAQNLFAGGEGGFFHSTDGGANWSSSGLTFVRSIAATSNGLLFAVVGTSTSSNLQKSIDGGATFSPINFGTTAMQNLVSVTVDSASGQTVYAVGNSSNGSQGGLYKSVDGGATWNAIKPGLTSTRLHRVLIDPTAVASLYLASEDNGVLLSASAGE